MSQQVADENHLRVLDSLVLKGDAIGLLNYRGEYSSIVAYCKNDIVKDEHGNLFICRTEFNDISPTGEFEQNATPGISLNNLTKWNILASTQKIENLPVTKLVVESSDSSSRKSKDSGRDTGTFTSRLVTLFRGSDSVGTPINITAIICVTKGSHGAVRLYDKTNNNIICEINGQSDETDHTVDMGTISNIPTSSAIWEIQTKGNALVQDISFLY